MKTWNWLVILVLVGVGAFFGGAISVGAKSPRSVETTRASAHDIKKSLLSMTDEECRCIPAEFRDSFALVEKVAARFECSRGDAWLAVMDLRHKLSSSEVTSKEDTSWSNCAQRLLAATRGSEPLDINVRQAAIEIAALSISRHGEYDALSIFRDRHGLNEK